MAGNKLYILPWQDHVRHMSDRSQARAGARRIKVKQRKTRKCPDALTGDAAKLARCVEIDDKIRPLLYRLNVDGVTAKDRERIHTLITALKKGLSTATVRKYYKSLAEA